MICHRLTKGSHNLASHNDIVLNLRVTKIKITILKAERLIGLTAVVDLKRELIITALSKNLYLLRHDLDITGCELVVLGTSLPTIERTKAKVT